MRRPLAFYRMTLTRWLKNFDQSIVKSRLGSKITLTAFRSVGL